MAFARDKFEGTHPKISHVDCLDYGAEVSDFDIFWTHRSNIIMQKNDTCFNFALTEHFKQDKPGKVFGNVRLYKYPVRELSISETLYYYLRATEKLRNSSKLLVSYIKPYKVVTSSTIGRWIKTLLGQEGVDTEIFSGHSTSCASTSKALMSVSTDVILATAGWTEESTFQKFYNKPVAVTNQMSLAVLT